LLRDIVSTFLLRYPHLITGLTNLLLLADSCITDLVLLTYLLLLPLSALFQVKLRLCLRLSELFLPLLTTGTQVHLLLLKDLRLSDLFLLLTDLLLLGLLLLPNLLQLLLPTLTRFVLLLFYLFLPRILLLTNLNVSFLVVLLLASRS